MRILPVLCVASWMAFGATATIDPNLYLEDVKFLASKEMRGRASGSRWSPGAKQPL